MHGPLEVSVIQYDHRVLAPQLQRAFGQILARLTGDVAARLGAAGEAEEVGCGDQRSTESRPRPVSTWKRSVGQAGLPQKLHRVERGEGGDLGRLQQHRVTGQQRRNGVRHAIVKG